MDGDTALAVTAKGKIFRAQTDFSKWSSTAQCGSAAFGVGLAGKVAVVAGVHDRCVSGDGGKTFDLEQVKKADKFVQYRGAAAAKVGGKHVLLAVGYPTTGDTNPLLHRSEDDGETWADLSAAIKATRAQGSARG